MRNRLFGLKNVVFSGKIEVYCCLHEISSKWLYVSIRPKKMLYGVFNKVAEIAIWWLFVINSKIGYNNSQNI